MIWIKLWTFLRIGMTEGESLGQILSHLLLDLGERGMRWGGDPGYDWLPFCNIMTGINMWLVIL